MKRCTLVLLFSLFVGLVSAAEITRVEPAFWWTDMKNQELQIMIYGPQIAKSEVSLNYPGVSLKEVVRVENPNYLFLYLDVTSAAKPGDMSIEFLEGKKKTTQNFALKPRATRPGAAGFSPEDVMYLIMPDRFANGDPSNDVIDDVAIDRSKPNARHGGDLRGLINKLDYIEDMGFTTIWLNPVQENRLPGGSYHGYAITDFYRVDPRFGTNEEYCEFIDKTHDKGMKVVMDMIFNHCGVTHWWMKDLPASDWLNNQTYLTGETPYVQTTHYKWTLMDVHAPKSEAELIYDAWFSRGMPDLNQRNRHLATYLIQNSIWWIEYSRIDGIRQDTHPYADYDFMARWCKAVEDEYPDFNIVGEAWYPRATAGAWWQRGSINNAKNSNLKSVMDFELCFVAQKSFGETSSAREGSESGLFNVYEVITQDYLFPDPNNILVFLDNHDIGRFSRSDEKDLNRYKQAMAFLLTTRGVPQIFYGTEILMAGGKNEGDGSIRKDFPGGWEGDPVDAFTAAGRTEKQNEAFNWMRTLLQWRKNNAAVRYGSLIHYTPDNTGCYVYARIKDNKKVLVVLNGTDKEQQIDPYRFREVLTGKKSGVDLFTNKAVDVTVPFAVPARGVYVMDLN